MSYIRPASQKRPGRKTPIRVLEHLKKGIDFGVLTIFLIGFTVFRADNDLPHGY